MNGYCRKRGLSRRRDEVVCGERSYWSGGRVVMSYERGETTKGMGVLEREELRS